MRVELKGRRRSRDIITDLVPDLDEDKKYFFAGIPLPPSPPLKALLA